VETGAAAAVEALFTPEQAVAEHPAVRAVTRLADDVLVPHAAAADDPRRGVDPAQLSLCGDAGLLAVGVPTAEGGLGGDARVDLEVVERLSGACGATWFVLTQHQMPQAIARGVLGLGDRWTPGPAAERHRPGPASGRTRAGIAVAHLRRPGPPAVRAEPDGAGWRLTGASDWCTRWGLGARGRVPPGAGPDRDGARRAAQGARPLNRSSVGAARPLVPGKPLSWHPRTGKWLS
jgi:alkylation response protein AidB-like acyl-CoA dehydrogenase